MMLSQNRLDAVLHDDRDTLAVRPLSRAETARVNGSKGGGPVTAVGKARSSTNALKHGLLSKRIAPLTDHRGERADYDHHLRDLIEEYQPNTRTELNLVELLAREWVRLARIGQHVEQLLVPQAADITPLDADVDLARRQLQTLVMLVDRFKRGLPLSLAGDDQEWVRASLGELLRSLREDADRYRARLRAGTADVSSVVSDNAQTYRRLTPKASRMLDEQFVGDVLDDRVEIPDRHRSQWMLLFRSALQRGQGRHRYAEQDAERHERECRRVQTGVTSRVDQLKLLQEYERQVRVSIERTVAMLLEIRRRREPAA